MEAIALENVNVSLARSNRTRDAAAAPSRRRIWAGRALAAVPALFLAMDGVMKVVQAAPAVEGTVKLGYPAGSLVGIGVAQLVCLALYLIPRTSVLGAVLLTGYLGGAIATHVRVGDPLFSHVLFPVYVAALVWGALYLRDARVRALVGRRPAPTSALGVAG